LNHFTVPVAIVISFLKIYCFARSYPSCAAGTMIKKELTATGRPLLAVFWDEHSLA